MYKYLVGVLFVVLFVGAGCNVNVDTNGERSVNLNDESASTNTEEAVDSSVDTELVTQEDVKPTANTTETKTPQITSASFDGNGVVIEGKNLSGSYLSFTTPSSKTPCREMVTPNCVLQKSVSTKTDIKFISNMIGGQGTYQLYVEKSTGEVSNKVTISIPTTSANQELSKEAMEAELKAFFEKEKGKTVSKIQVILQDGMYVKGEVSFVPTTADEPQAGAIFFVKKQNEKWALTHYGNGQIPCSLETKYGFPKTFLWDCAE